MKQNKYKKSGWFKESERHSLASKGIKTGRKSSYSPTNLMGLTLEHKKDIKERVPDYAKLPKEVSIHKHNWSFEKEGNKIKLTLGNLSDAGWFWDGNQDDMVLFLDRINKSHIRDEFLQSMKETKISFNDLKPVLLKSADKGSGLYSVTGDNVRWKFGEDETDIAEELDYHVQEGHIKESQRGELEDEFWSNYQGVNYDDFIKENGKLLKNSIKDSVKNSNSYDDFFNNMDEVRDEANEYYQESQFKEVNNTMRCSIKEVKGD